MKMTKFSSTIDAYGATICKLAQKNPQAVFLAADVSKAYSIDPFITCAQDRFFNTGVAEQNTMGIAAGMATCGKLPIVHIYTPFASMRALEQWRDDICYPNLNVKVIGICGGIIMGIGGTTHQTVEDLAIHRAVPNVTLVVPCDPIESKLATEAMFYHTGPLFMRLGRYPMPEVYTEEFEFELGKANYVREGTDATIIATGHMVSYAVEASETLEKEGVKACVIDFHTLKPIDETIIVNTAKKTGAIITVEEHSIIGGLGSAVAEIVVENYPVPMKRIGIPDTFGGIGPTNELFNKYGLSTKNIIEQTKKLLNMKKQ
jgi:transketolase